MTLPLMPKATAVWLIDNTTLTFDQIAEFCGMHPLEVKGIADGEVAQGIMGQDPIVTGQLTADEIKKSQEHPKRKLELSIRARKHLESKKKKAAKYTPIARRQDKPDAITWLLKNCPNANEAQIAKLIGTTKTTIAAIKTKSHWNIANIRARDPVLLGLCTQIELNNFLNQMKIIAGPSKTEETDNNL